MQILTYQVKRSGHQVWSKSDVQSEIDFKLEDRTVGTVLVRMFSNIHDEVLEWIPTEYLFRILILVTSVQVNFRPGPFLWRNYSFAHNR